MVFEAEAKQPLLIVYVTVPVPAEAPPVTDPEFDPKVTALKSPLPLHVPPVVASVKVTVMPEHSYEGPCIGVGFAFTVNTAVAMQLPVA